MVSPPSVENPQSNLDIFLKLRSGSPAVWGVIEGGLHIIPRWALIHLEPQKWSCLQQPPCLHVWILTQTSSYTFSHGANSLFPSIQHFFVAEIMQDKPCPSEKGLLSGCDCLICTEESSWLRHLRKVKHSIKFSSKNYFPVSYTPLCLSPEKHWVSAFTWPVMGKSLQKAI